MKRDSCGKDEEKNLDPPKRILEKTNFRGVHHTCTETCGSCSSPTIRGACQSAAALTMRFSLLGMCLVSGFSMCFVLSLVFGGMIDRRALPDDAIFLILQEIQLAAAPARSISRPASVFANAHPPATVRALFSQVAITLPADPELLAATAFSWQLLSSSPPLSQQLQSDAPASPLQMQFKRPAMHVGQP